MLFIPLENFQSLYIENDIAFYIWDYELSSDKKTRSQIFKSLWKAIGLGQNAKSCSIFTHWKPSNGIKNVRFGKSLLVYFLLKHLESCSLKQLNKLVHFSLGKLNHEGTWSSYHFVFFSLKKVPFPLGHLAWKSCPYVFFPFILSMKKIKLCTLWLKGEILTIRSIFSLELGIVLQLFWD